MPEEETQTDDETPVSEEPIYFLCPLCQEKGRTVGFQDLRKIAGHYNYVHAKAMGNKMEFKDIKDRIPTTTERPPNLIERDKQSARHVQAQKQKGVKMPDDDGEHIAPELGDAAGIRGKIKSLLVNLAKLDKTQREELLSEREQLVEYSRILSLKDVSYEQIREIEAAITTDIEPKIRSALSPSEEEDDEPAPGQKKDLNWDLKMDVEKTRAAIKKDLQDLMDLPQDILETVETEKQLYVELNRLLCKDDITKKELQDIRARHQSYQPIVHSAIKKAKRMAEYDQGEEDDDSDYDIASLEKTRMKQLQKRLARTQIMRDLREEELSLRQLNMNSNPQPAAPASNMVPVVRPKLGADGQPMKDEKGNIITEVAYQPSQLDPVLSILISALLPGLANNRNNGNMEELVLKLERDRLQHELELARTQQQQQQNNPLQAELSRIQIQMNQQQEAYHRSELERLNNQIASLGRAANRDTIKELLDEKQRLQTLGLIPAPQQTEQQLANAYSMKALDEATRRADKAASDLKEVAAPLFSMQADILKSQLQKNQAQQPASGAPSPSSPPQLSEEERKRKWNQLRQNLDVAYQAQ